MTPPARALVLSRIAACPDRGALLRVWDSLSDRAKEDGKVVQAFREHAEALK